MRLFGDISTRMLAAGFSSLVVCRFHFLVDLLLLESIMDKLAMRVNEYLVNNKDTFLVCPSCLSSHSEISVETGGVGINYIMILMSTIPRKGQMDDQRPQSILKLISSSFQ